MISVDIMHAWRIGGTVSKMTQSRSRVVLHSSEGWVWLCKTRLIRLFNKKYLQRRDDTAMVTG